MGNETNTAAGIEAQNTAQAGASTEADTQAQNTANTAQNTTQNESNKKKIYATQNICGICGKQVDFGFKFPHPLSPCIDHIIPVAKGGHPSALENLQLAHMCCNRQKSDKLTVKQIFDSEVDLISNRVLPQTFDWKNI